ncbi:ESCRT-II complex, vps25 subunit [Dothidotthia symphoricarpi CBS 119687]|uniref:Vacuolar protein-sorting-associated protein 25 n=1 Tax=Dothidotthia symphoricarpi CBS 119687 TaxID=1392245 RepID=A0A6A6AJ85_9PLEO|nr:ESCRT-II complex, vps25 subunit [Dothidotthia symphoricarpi CBS 119687]KAF2131626.1 ESCRT-II complex, vps25 subunit [Dothidotthia symphoricarpi CBS 119687]
MTTASPLPNTSTPQPSATPTGFQFPPHYSFPPFFTLQPVASTRSSQLASWSTLIQAYCRHNRIFTLSLIDALNTPLFHNAALSRRLSLRDATALLKWMSTSEGGNRAEYIAPPGTSAKKKSGVEDEGGRFWIYWRRPDEWAGALEEWVERTGQKGSVLTFYEIVEGEATMKEEFWGMEGALLMKSLGICVKRGRAQIFGSEGSEGVKFF